VADERQLIERYQQGDQTAAEAIFRLYHPAIHSLAYRMLGGSPEVEDCVQEVFLRAFRGLKGFRGEASLKTWIYRIATNTCLNYLDKAKRRGPVDSLDAEVFEEGFATLGDTLASEERSPEDQVMGVELEEAIQVALDKLAPEFRTALVLRDVEGMSYEEVASVTGAALGTVKSRIARARTQAVRWLKDYLK
jgi:RNA polymerase sigma factor, sigma-70 family